MGERVTITNVSQSPPHVVMGWGLLLLLIMLQGEGAEGWSPAQPCRWEGTSSQAVLPVPQPLG